MMGIIDRRKNTGAFRSKEVVIKVISHGGL